MSSVYNTDQFLIKMKSDFDKIRQIMPIEMSESFNNFSRSDNANLWELANLIGRFYNSANLDKQNIQLCQGAINSIREFQGQKAKSNPAGTMVVFGTSGWRGVIGEGFTVLNVHKVVCGIIQMMKDDEFLKVNGYSSFQEVQKNGILLLRDNRFMGDIFIDAAKKELAAEEILIYDAGECPTGVGSAVLTELQAAGSINFTPSHNPMAYAGIKFNPSDGGPADKNLTSLIEKYSNALMGNKVSFRPAEPAITRAKKIDAAKIFIEFIGKNKIFNLDSMRTWLKLNSNYLFLVVDFMHGSSRGYIEKLLGDGLLEELKKSNSVKFINTNDDYSFHGMKPEPNPHNQRKLIDILQKNQRKFTLAVALDPDADRIRYADSKMDIDMNRFGAIAYAHLIQKGLKGAICSTVPSSDFALAIAKQEGQDVNETAVGFKYFRELLKSGKVLIAFEESDGISLKGHTLEKCALAGFLLALDAISQQEKTLSEQFLNLQQKYGYYYPGKSGTEIKGVSVKEWQSYKAKVLGILQKGMYNKGDIIRIGKKSKIITDILTLDGVKLIFEDKSWILLRPSGTEPKFRYYFEIVSETRIDDIMNLMGQYESAAEDILNKARNLAEQVQ